MCLPGAPHGGLIDLVGFLPVRLGHKRKGNSAEDQFGPGGFRSQAKISGFPAALPLQDRWSGSLLRTK